MVAILALVVGPGCFHTNAPVSPASEAAVGAPLHDAEKKKPHAPTSNERGPQDAPFDVAAPSPKARRTELGVHVLLLDGRSSSDESPGELDEVRVHYQGWTTDGALFDSSRQRGVPATFPLDRVIPGFRDGIMQLRPGQSARLWIPQELAYDGIPGAPRGMLVFEVELLEIVEKPPEERDIPAPPDVAAPPKDATVMASGLAFRVLQAGTGSTSPREHDEVVVHYTGWTTDGTMFDSSVKRGNPATFVPTKLIAGWRQGIPLMVVGESRRFWIPEDLAYQGKPGAPEGMLVFDVELLEIHPKADPPPVPENVAKPPGRARRTTSGLRYLRLQRGSGKERPTAVSNVKVHYSGWTTDGTMFDSSVTRGMPATFPLDRVIPGWTEAVQLMRVGDVFRVWIPEELAYKGNPGHPSGMLVFDIELLEIVN